MDNDTDLELKIKVDIKILGCQDIKTWDDKLRMKNEE
jgi:hypothetical protein